jgi:uncharacterized protein (TIGR00106 family)
MAVAEISIEPLGTDSPSVGDLITASVQALKKEGNLKFDVTAMGTVVEGDSAQLLQAALRMQEACFQAGAKRVLLSIRLDERHDKTSSMEQMESKVERNLGLGGVSGLGGSRPGF